MTDVCPVVDCDAPPEHGLLCPRHRQRLADHWGAREGNDPREHRHGLPWIWDHLVVAHPYVHGSSGLGVVGGDGPADREAERLAVMMAVRDDIHAHLVGTAQTIAARIGRAGPELGHGRRLDNLRSARWLLANLDHATAHPTVADIAVDADRLATQAHALAPWRPAPNRHRDAVCICSAVGTIVDTDDGRRCWRCGRAYTDEQWATASVRMASWARHDPDLLARAAQPLDVIDRTPLAVRTWTARDGSRWLVWACRACGRQNATRTHDRPVCLTCGHDHRAGEHWRDTA